MHEGEVEFLLVYIREAHPTDGLQDEANLREKIELPNARTITEKTEHARSCATKLDLKFPTVIDEMDNRVEQAYTAWPDRLYVIGRDGRIAWKGRPGPDGFSMAELAAALLDEVDREY